MRKIKEKRVRDEDCWVTVIYKNNGVIQPPWTDEVYPPTEEKTLKVFWEGVDWGVGDREFIEVVEVFC